MVVSRQNQQFQTTLNLSPVSFTEQKLPSAPGLGLGKPWGLQLSPTEGCSLKTLTQVCTARLYKYNTLRKL